MTAADGRGVHNVWVSLTLANGEEQSVLTAPGGEYSFTGISVGETFNITVHSKRFRFERASQIRTVTIEDEEVNFTALE